MHISLLPWICEEDMQQFAAQLRTAREVRKMTQARLAELIKVDRRVYNRWERGTSVPQLDTVVKLAQVLQTSVDSLVGLKPSTPPQIQNPRLQALVAQMNSLSDEDQQALIVLMDSLLKRSQMTQLLTS